MTETIKRAAFGNPSFKRKCIVCIIISQGVNEIGNGIDFIREFEGPLLEKLEEIRDQKILHETESYRLFATNKDGLRLKIYFEKLSYFKLEQWNVPRPPIPITDNNAFFVSVTLPNENDYEEYSNRNGSSWSWSSNG